MKIAVCGLWHLGCVTAACLAHIGHDVVAYDANESVVNQLQQGKAPVYEPNLDDMLKNNLQAKKLLFTYNKKDLSDVEIIWITYDTPVDDADHADVAFVTDAIIELFVHVKTSALIIISSQLPVGTTRQLISVCNEKYADKKLSFAYCPENLRLGKAIEIFMHPDRIVVGLQTANDEVRIEKLLSHFSTNILWMSIESAEMAKHALNAFLATSVVFINEIAVLCEQVGADANDVEKSLKSEARIGPKAYLRAGGAIGGGTLARDVKYLLEIGKQHAMTTPLFSALLESNQAHKTWSARRVLDVLTDLNGKTIATLGLTYKPGTNTLRRSIAVEICQFLSMQGAKIHGYDPMLQELPAEIAEFIQLKSTLNQALHNADAVIVTTEHPHFSELTTEQLLDNVKQAIIFDASGFLKKNFADDKRVQYYSVGRQI